MQRLASNGTESNGEIYKFEKLDTKFIDPGLAFVKESVLAPAVEEFIRQNNFKKPVYMITGVKIARGADVALTRSRESETHAIAGPELTISSINSETTRFGESFDFVFAYRLREIYYEKGQVKHKECDKGALQGIDDGSPEKADETSLSSPSLEISGLAQEDVSGEDLAIREDLAIDEDDGEECAIITSKG